MIPYQIFKLSSTANNIKWAKEYTIYSDLQQALLTCRRPRSQHLVETLPAALPSLSPSGSSVTRRSDAPADVFAANLTVVKYSASATWLPPINTCIPGILLGSTALPPAMSGAHAPLARCYRLVGNQPPPATEQPSVFVSRNIYTPNIQ